MVAIHLFIFSMWIFVFR